MPTYPLASPDMESLRSIWRDENKQYLDNLIRKLQSVVTPEFIAGSVRQSIIENSDVNPSLKMNIDKVLSFFSFSTALKTEEYENIEENSSYIGSATKKSYKFRFKCKTYDSMNRVVVAILSELAHSNHYGYTELKRLCEKYNVTKSIIKLESEITDANRRKYPNIITLDDNVKVGIWNNWYYYTNFKPVCELAKGSGLEITLIPS